MRSGYTYSDVIESIEKEQERDDRDTCRGGSSVCEGAAESGNDNVGGEHTQAGGQKEEAAANSVN